MSKKCSAGIVLVLAAVAVLSDPIPVRAQNGTGEKYALLIAVRKYDPTELRDLRYAEQDVTDLARVLQQGGYRKQHVVLMTQTVAADTPRFAPEAGKIRKELDALLQLCDESDTLLVAFAGHGVQFKGGEETFFCPSDAKLSDRKTLVSLDEVYRKLESCRAGLKLLLADVCRSDPQANASRAQAVVELQSVTRPQQQRPPGGVAAFFSCSAGEKAFEHDDLKHGVFFHYVIEGLKGAAADRKGQVTLPDLEKYVKQEVKTFAYDKFGVTQRPEILNKTRELVPLVRVAVSTETTTASPPRPTPKPELPALPNFAGSWAGTWENSVGETGDETLYLKEESDGTFSGTWWDTIPVKGERRGRTEIYFEGRTARRYYQAVGRFSNGELVINYTAYRLDSEGKYYGQSRLKRSR